MQRTNADALMRTETVKASGDIDVDEASTFETALSGVAAPGVRIEVDLSSAGAPATGWGPVDAFGSHWRCPFALAWIVYQPGDVRT